MICCLQLKTAPSIKIIVIIIIVIVTVVIIKQEWVLRRSETQVRLGSS